MNPKGSALAVLSIALMSLAAVFASNVDASHPETFPDWRYRWQPLRPGVGYQLFYQAAKWEDDPLPTGEALILLDAVENKWEPFFTHHGPFAFNPVPWESWAHASFWRVPGQNYISYFCRTDNQLVSGCFVPNVYTWGSGCECFNVQHGIIPFGPHSFHHSSAWLSHVLAHEWGHGFTLKHHEPCDSVMNGIHNACFVDPSHADAHTGLNQLGY